MCINKKVVAALVAAAVVVYLVAPGAIGAAAPLLILVICPLSMIVMMRAMSGGRNKPAQVEDSQPSELADLRAEVERLREEQRPAPALAPPTPGS